MNYSKQRELIKDTLTNNPVHPSAEQLHKIIKLKYPEEKVGIATVYRNLKKMADEGEIKRIAGLEESEHFDHNIHEHYHIICNKCKKIFDIDKSIAPDIVKKLQNKTNFKITGYDIVVYGLCKDCQSE